MKIIRKLNLNVAQAIIMMITSTTWTVTVNHYMEH